MFDAFGLFHGDFLASVINLMLFKRCIKLSGCFWYGPKKLHMPFRTLNSSRHILIITNNIAKTR